MSMQILRGSSSIDTVTPKNGQLAYNTSTNILKVGDGTSKFQNLPNIMSNSSEIESGSWSPLVSTGDNTNYQDHVVFGQYTKCGHSVTITAELDLRNLTVTSGKTVYIKNLPFVCSPVTGMYIGFSYGMFGSSMRANGLLFADTSVRLIVMSFQTSIGNTGTNIINSPLSWQGSSSGSICAIKLQATYYTTL